jgi:very-short-patch-repair endonuclease
VPLLERPIQNCTQWDEEQIRNAENAISNAAACIDKLATPPELSAWFGAGLPPQSPFDISRMRTTIDKALILLEELTRAAQPAITELYDQIDLTLHDVAAVTAALRHVVAVPLGARAALADPAWADEPAKLLTLAQLGCRVQAATAHINAAFHHHAWGFDPAPLIHALRADGNSWLRLASARYRQAVRDLKALARELPPKTTHERIALAEELSHARQLLSQFAQTHPFAAKALGPLWLEEETKWPQVSYLLDWTTAALRLKNGRKFIQLAARHPDVSELSRFADHINAKADEFSAVLRDLLQATRLDASTALRSTNIATVSLPAIASLLAGWKANLDTVNDWVAARDALAKLRQFQLIEIAQGLQAGTIPTNAVATMLQVGMAEALWKCATEETPELRTIDGTARSQDVVDFRHLDRERIARARHEVLQSYLARKPNGSSGEMAIIRGEINKKRGNRAARKLMEDAGAAVQRLKPVFMMSPLSVAQFLPPGKMKFDLVVIDEASQVAPGDALGSIARADQIVVVGDREQLPPTNFFKMVSAGADDPDDDDAQEEQISRPSEYESILTLARSRGFGQRMLTWHYRSKHPSLIAISNKERYGNKLLLPPSPLIETNTHGLSLVLTERGHYGRGGTRRDLVQAKIVAEAVAKHIMDQPTLSLGVVCLSVQQRDAVEDMIDQLNLRSAVESFLPQSDERLLIKSLEEIQGDERDVMFISMGYGFDHDGHMTKNFGPISRDGGERRLNVLISRARQKCVAFSCFTSADIPTGSKSVGTEMLRSFLHFAETGKIAAGDVDPDDFDSPFEEAVAAEIAKAGYRFHSQVGVSGFRIDLGVINPERPGRFVLGVECDGATYHSARSARDRDRLRQEVLEGLGWKLHRIWSTDWFRNPARETERLLAAIRAADIPEPPTDHPSSRDASRVNSTEPAPALIDALQDDDHHGNETAEDIHALSSWKIRPYIECKLSLPQARNLSQLSQQELLQLVAQVVEAEGPIHTNEVARRVREASGLARTGHRIQEKIRCLLLAAARKNIVERSSEFWTIPGHQLDHVRDRRQCSLSLRQADQIAPTEYQLAVQMALADAVSLTQEELVVQTARLFGFDRTGPEIRVAIESAISALQQARSVVEIGQRLQRAPS